MPVSAKYICSARTVKTNINGEEKDTGHICCAYSKTKTVAAYFRNPNPTDYMNIISYYAGDC